MLVALPSSIAYGVVVFTAISPSLAAAGAMAGILGAAILGVTAPLVGRNAGFITAPCAPAAAVLGGLAAQLVGTHRLPAARIVALLALTALLSSVLQIIYGALRAGRIIKFIPYQVVTGYLSGVAVIIASAQLPKLLGAAGKTDAVTALRNPASWHWPGIVVGLVTIIAMALALRFIKRVPAAIIGLGAGIASYFALGALFPELLTLRGNSHIIGPIQTSGSFLQVSSERIGALMQVRTSDFTLIIGSALTLSVLLSIDTLKTGVVLDVLTRRRHDSNRELVAQGVANLASFAGGGMPGAGTMGPTLVNVTSGGQTIRSSIIEGALVFITLLVFAKFVAWVPIAALAGLLLVVAWRMFDFSIFRLLRQRSTRLDFAVIATVVIVAEAVGLIEASLVGVFMAMLLFIRNQIRTSVILRKTYLNQSRSKRRRSSEANEILNSSGHEAAIVQLQGDLFFGTTDQLFSELEQDLNERRFILLDLRRVQSIDFTAAHLFEQMHERLHEREGDLLFSGMPSKARSEIEHYMSELGLMTGEGAVAVFETRDGALEWMEEQLLRRHGWPAAESAPPISLEEFALLEPLGREAQEALARMIEERHVVQGTTVFARGDTGDEIYFVRRGRVHVLLPLEGGKRHHLATLCRGEFFGEMAFLDRGVRSADAEAAVDTDLYILSRARFDEFARHDAEIAAVIFEELARAIAERLRTTDAELRALEER